MKAKRKSVKRIAPPNEMSRRRFVALSLTASLGVASGSSASEAKPVIEQTVEFKTADGVCDAAFIHPAKGAHPGVLIWHDSLMPFVVFV